MPALLVEVVAYYSVEVANLAAEFASPSAVATPSNVLPVCLPKVPTETTITAPTRAAKRP